jgi:hypothetical protein
VSRGKSVLRGTCTQILATEVPMATVMFLELDMSQIDITCVDDFAHALADLLGLLLFSRAD